MDDIKNRLGFGGDRDWDGNDGDGGQREDGYADGGGDDGQPVGNRGYASAYKDSPGVKVVSRNGSTTSPSSSSSSRYGASALGSQTYGTRRPSNFFVEVSDVDSGRFAPVSSEPEYMRNRGSRQIDSLRSSIATNAVTQGDEAHADTARPSRPAASTASTSGAGYDAYSDYLAASPRRDTKVSAGVKVLAPSSYNEAESIVSAFKGGSSVALSLANARPELAKRILDFSFGVATALDGKVEKIADKVFFLSHSASGLTPEERKQLIDAGILHQ